MSQMTETFMYIVLSLSAVAILVWAIWLVDKKRTADLRRVAVSLNLSFTAKDNDLVDAMQAFHLFSQGHTRRVRNILHGRANDTDVKIFDYQYTVGSGKQSTIYLQTVILFRSSRLDLPRFTLQPERWYHKMGAMLGHADIDFGSHPKFSGLYLLRGKEEDRIRATFTTDVLDYYAAHPKCASEGGGNTFLFWRRRRRVSPKAIQHFMAEGFGLFSRFT